MSLWPGHLHPSISERKGDISACSLEPNPLPSWLIRSGLFRSSANILLFLSLVRDDAVFFSEVERGEGVSFCASAMVTRLMREGLSVDRQATHVEGFTGQALPSRSDTSLQLLLSRNGHII